MRSACRPSTQPTRPRPAPPHPPRPLRRTAPARTGLRPGTGPHHVGFLQLRRLVHDHLGPLRLPDPLRLRHGHRGAGPHRVGLALRRADDPAGGPGHGRGLLQLPHGRRPVLLGRQAGPAQRPGRELVHRLVQLPRAGRRHRRHRLRRRPLPQRPARPPGLVLGHPRPHGAAARPDPGPARRAQHLRRAAGRRAQQHQRVVAHPGRGRHRRRAGHRTGPPPVGRLRLHPLHQHHRLAQHGVRRARSDCCWRSTPSPATTPPRT